MLCTNLLELLTFSVNLSPFALHLWKWLTARLLSPSLWSHFSYFVHNHVMLCTASPLLKYSEKSSLLKRSNMFISLYSFPRVIISRHSKKYVKQNNPCTVSYKLRIETYTLKSVCIKNAVCNPLKCKWFVNFSSGLLTFPSLTRIWWAKGLPSLHYKSLLCNFSHPEHLFCVQFSALSHVIPMTPKRTN